MKKLIFISSILLFVLTFSNPAFSQRGSRLAAKAWTWAERALTLKGIYDWVNESRETTSRYVNPTGTWQSTSGAIFYATSTSYGMKYENAYGEIVTASASNTTNFYTADRPEAHYYYTILDRNTIVVNTCQGYEFWWSRVK